MSFNKEKPHRLRDSSWDIFANSFFRQHWFFFWFCNQFNLLTLIQTKCLQCLLRHRQSIGDVRLIDGHDLQGCGRSSSILRILQGGCLLLQRSARICVLINGLVLPRVYQAWSPHSVEDWRPLPNDLSTRSAIVLLTLFYVNQEVTFVLIFSV